MTSPTMIAAYLALFFLLGFLFLLINMCLGWLIRPKDPHEEKLEIYECGEPTIGSSFVQFDLRFYVVALVFIVFEAEVAFLFPVATSFGKATSLANSPETLVMAAEATGQAVLSPSAEGLYRELGVSYPAMSSIEAAAGETAIRDTARQLGWLAFWAIHLFFFVLLAGFAYEWKVGSLDWVRTAPKRGAPVTVVAPPAAAAEQEMAGVN